MKRCIRGATLRGLAAVSTCTAAMLAAANPSARAQSDDLDRAPIEYSSSTPNNPVSRLQARLDAGRARLKFEDDRGYLRSVLSELSVPESSQMLVYSKTSLQRNRISPSTPRAVFFSDDMYIGFCLRGSVLEVSAADPTLGAVFYSLEQQPREKPKFERQTDNCMLCHSSSQTQGVPGHLVRSTYVDPTGMPIYSLGSHRIDHTTPLANRWGGWYVSGTHGKQTHLGNLICRGVKLREEIDNRDGQNVTELAKRIDLGSYPSRHSDLVALMVMEHQAEAHNLLTRANFQTRQALYQEAALNREMGEKPDRRWEGTTSRIKGAGDPLVKYLLFCGEAELTEPIRGTSSFADDFQKRGPADAQGRSLRQLDLTRRLFKYPCSYLIYSASFDGLPSDVKDHVYRRLWDVLTDRDRGSDFAHLSTSDRQAILDILRATKKDLPAYWQVAKSSAGH